MTAPDEITLNLSKRITNVPSATRNDVSAASLCCKYDRGAV
jgi:hypothetical protein